MKQRVLCALLSALLLCLPAGALAAESGAGTESAVPEAGMTIVLPDDLYVLTRESTAEQLAQFGMEQADWLAYCESSNLYVEAVQPDSASGRLLIELLIFVSEDNSGLRDMNRASEKEILDICKGNAMNSEVSAKLGITYDDTPEICNTDQARFVRMTFAGEQQGVSVHGRQYYTIYGSKAINITMRSYDGPVTDAMAAMQDAALASVHFDTEPDKTPVRAEGGFVSGVLRDAVGGAIIGAIVGAALIISNRRKKRKAAQAMAAAAAVQPETAVGSTPDGENAADRSDAAGPEDQGGAE